MTCPKSTPFRVGLCESYQGVLFEMHIFGTVAAEEVIEIAASTSPSQNQKRSAARMRRSSISE
jgi:hypothetical protein